MSDQMTARLSVRVPAELAEKVRKKSERTGIAYSHAIRRFLEFWVEEDGLVEETLRILALRLSAPSAFDPQTLSELIHHVQSSEAGRQQ